MILLSVSVPPSIGKLAGFLSSSFVGAVFGRFVRGSVASRRADEAGEAPNGVESSNAMITSRATDRVPMRPALLRRVRTGRLPLPRQVAELTPDDEPALAAVNAFADRLAQLPLAEWLTVGRKMIESPSEYAHRETPYAILEATINERGLGVAAWYMRDAIETSAFYAGSTMTRWTSIDRRAFAAAHALAEDTGLALLAREALAIEDFGALAAPFATLVREATTAG